MYKYFILILILFSVSSCAKNSIEMKNLEGTWLSIDGNINSYLNLSKNVSLEFVVFDVQKDKANYYQVFKYKNSTDTIGFEEGNLQILDNGEIMLRNLKNTSVYIEQNIKELTDARLRYSFTIQERNFDFTLKKQ